MREPAKDPNDLERLFVERANAGDIDGLVALYEPDAVVANGSGEVAVGREEIRAPAGWHMVVGRGSVCAGRKRT